MKTAYFNRFVIEMPSEAVPECSHQGECYDDCHHWQSKLNLDLDRADMIAELEEYGAWSLEELTEKDNAELEIILIWLAAGNIQEEE